MKVISLLDYDNYERNAVLKHISNLNYGRAVGSIGEKKAINYIKTQVSNNNGEVRIEPFYYISRNLIFKNLSRNIFFMIVVLITLTIFQDIVDKFNFALSIYLQLYLNLFLMVLKCFFIVIFIYYTFKRYLYYYYRLITRFDTPFKENEKNKSYNISSNVIHTDSNNNHKKVLIFSAHYDSISTNYRIKYFIIQMLFTSLFIAIYEYMDLTLFQHISFGIVVIIIASSLFLFKFENKSTGSIDNASGVALLLELNRFFTENPLNNYNIIFLWTGAEELGLWGAREYCNHHFTELSEDHDLNNSFYINIDMVGTHLGIIKKDDPSKKNMNNNLLNKLFLEISKKSKIHVLQHKSSHLYTSDNKVFEYFAKKNNYQLDSCWICSKNDIEFIHSPKDNMGKCSEYELANCLYVCKELALRIDNGYIKQSEKII